jgi:homoserine dehydrogenase
MTTRQVGVAILGLGTIGGAVATTLQERGDHIEARYGLRPVLRAVLERDLSRIERFKLAPEIVASDKATILTDEGIDVVVEVLGGEQPAADFMLRCLGAGKHVVTANKEAVSKHLGRLVATARDQELGFLFEASVGGGIPLMVSYRQILATNRVTRIRGIVNGTTNYILSQMATQGASYGDALAEAQRLGYAEPNPTADVEGFDATYKLAILASLMTGRHITPDAVARTGIAHVTPEDVQSARARGGTIKLIASASTESGNLILGVAPEFVPGDDVLAHVGANFNAIELVGDRVGPVVLTGQGAGPLPTSSAIVSDVIDAALVGAAATPVVRG